MMLVETDHVDKIQKLMFFFVDDRLGSSYNLLSTM